MSGIDSRRNAWRWGALALLGLCCAGLVAWWMQPVPEVHVASESQEAEPIVRRFTPRPSPGPAPEPAAERARADGPVDPAPVEDVAEDEDVRGRLVIDVIDEDGRPTDRARVWVRGCPAERVGFGEFRVGEGACVVRAGRRDGALWARSRAVEVQVPARGEEYVQVELSSRRTGGLGVSIRPAEGGIRVVRVMPGTPAAELGLEAGDLIVEVDGVDTRDLDMRDFVQTMTGPEGTAVDFVVEYETEEGVSQEALSITRTFLDRS